MNFDDLNRLSCKKSQIIIQEPDFNRVNSVSVFYRKTLYQNRRILCSKNHWRFAFVNRKSKIVNYLYPFNNILYLLKKRAFYVVLKPFS